MKNKLLLGILIVSSALSLPSCKKDYKCECTDNSSGLVVTAVTVTSRNKPLAQTTCETYNISSSQVTCKLK